MYFKYEYRYDNDLKGIIVKIEEDNCCYNLHEIILLIDVLFDVLTSEPLFAKSETCISGEVGLQGITTSFWNWRALICSVDSSMVDKWDESENLSNEKLSEAQFKTPTINI